MSAPLYQLQGKFTPFRDKWLAARAIYRTYPAGKVLYPLHTAWPTVLYIDRGTVRASIQQEEREKLIAAYGPGMLVPYAAPASVPVSHRVQFSAETEISGWELSCESFRKLLTSDRAFCDQYMTAMWQLIHLLLHEVQSISFDTGLERVASFLYTYFENTGRDRLEIPARDLQAYIGLNKSNLNKYLSVLGHDKVISREKGTISILSPTKLRTYCSPRIIECTLRSLANTKMGKLDDEEKWQAICRRDASYDGTFWYGVRSTGVFCNPSCKSRRPNRENIEYFSTIEEARAAGYRPCKRCRPDVKSYRPNQKLLSDIREFFDKHFDDDQMIHDELEHLPMTMRHFNRLFKLQYDQTPHSYILNKRLEKAARMLTESDESVLDISLAAGFNSISSFYTAFKRAYGTSPAQYKSSH